jgi:hypothetical protein
MDVIELQREKHIAPLESQGYTGAFRGFSGLGAPTPVPLSGPDFPLSPKPTLVVFTKGQAV